MRDPPPPREYAVRVATNMPLAWCIVEAGGRADATTKPDDPGLDIL